MVKILVGSYTNAIYTLNFDPTADQASRLTLSSSIDVGFHPSWIAPHPNNGSTGSTIVFTGLEQEVGEIVVVSFDADGKGKVEASGISTRGADPCTVLVTKDEVIAGNVSPETRCSEVTLNEWIPVLLRVGDVPPPRPLCPLPTTR